MKQQRLVQIALAAAAMAGFGIAAVAQQPSGQAPAPQRTPPANDPFFRKPPPVPVAAERKSNEPVLIPHPPFEQRQQEFQRARQEARSRGLAEPDPIGQYLVSELNVTGIFETETGPGAFVQAIPTNTMFFVGAGARVFNGEIVSISSGVNFDLGQVKFKEATKYRIKKQEQIVVNDVTKGIQPPR